MIYRAPSLKKTSSLVPELAPHYFLRRIWKHHEEHFFVLDLADPILCLYLFFPFFSFCNIVFFLQLLSSLTLFDLRPWPVSSPSDV